ncbi:MAG: DUF4912 domain-containing protein [Nitrospirota bacterium]
MKKEELASKTIAELKALARKNKIALPVGATKAVIIKALSRTGAAAKGKKAAAAKKTKKTAAPAPARKKAATKTTKPVVKKAKAAVKKQPVARTGAKKRAAVPLPGVQAVQPREWQMPAGMEGPLEAQERVSDAKFFTGAPEHKPPMPYDSLPHEYGSERMALMARDPFMAFSYWELPQDRLDKEKAWFGWDSKLCVRVYDVTGVQFNGTNAAAYFDQEVYDRVGSWYFDLGRPTHSFCADLGLLAPNGRFLTLVRSNMVVMPRDGVSDVLDEEWMLVDEEFMKLYGIPGTSRGMLGGLSSPEAQELLRQRRLMEITSPGTFPRRGTARKK